MHQKEPVIISHERFLTKFYYDSTTNKMGENLFEKFNLPKGIICHKNLAVKLYSLIPVLEHFDYKLLFTDVFRPVEMQQYLYEHWEEKTGEQPKFSLAGVEKAPHPRGIAIDAVLADNNGEKLLLPSSSISFNAEQRNPDFEDFTEDEIIKKKNRNFLRYLMACAGISPINKEWFHFQLSNSEGYEPISVEEAKNAIPFEYKKENFADYKFFDVPSDYQNEESPHKTHFWITDERYFDGLPLIELSEFKKKLQGILDE